MPSAPVTIPASIVKAAKAFEPRLRIGWNPVQAQFEWLYLRSMPGTYHALPEPTHDYHPTTGVRHHSLAMLHVIGRRKPTWADYHLIRSMDRGHVRPKDFMRQKTEAADRMKDRQESDDRHRRECTFGEPMYEHSIGRVRTGWEPKAAC
jgi:hypothetical protein